MVGEVHHAAAVVAVLYVSAQTQRIRAAGRVNQQIELGELVVVAPEKVRLIFFISGTMPIVGGSLIQQISRQRNEYANSHEKKERFREISERKKIKSEKHYLHYPSCRLTRF